MKKANFILGITALSTMPALGQTASSRPNIVYILMDDLGFGDIGCYGQEKIETPHIDQLRQEGMRFTQHYTGSPVSAPARCVLMTGMHSGHAQIRYNNEMAYRGATNDHDSMFVHKELEGQYPLKANTMTIGRMMQNAGYHRMLRQVGTGISRLGRYSQQTGIQSILWLQLPAPGTHLLPRFPLQKRRACISEKQSH